MKKKKLSKGQHRQVQRNHERRLNQVLTEAESPIPSNTQQGTVVSRLGQHVDVEDNNGNIYRCSIRRTIASLITGDHVVWSCFDDQPNSTIICGVVEAVYDRTSLLTRPDTYEGIKPIAANIDQVVIVSSLLPELSLNIIDRYLVACEYAKLPALIVINKIDLTTNTDHIATLMQIYQRIGYQTLLLSNKTKQGLPELALVLKDKTNIFVGQSGVGKSSLLNSLLPELNNSISVNTISENSGLGQHTTTAARLYHLNQGGDVIDSPGIREFALWHFTQQQIAYGFIEFRPYLQQCKFRDCQHKNDPGCEIKKAVEQGEIAIERFNSYHKIIESIHPLKNKNKLSNKKIN